MNDHNKYVTLTITIAFTILLAASGWAFGIVKNQSQKELTRIETKVDAIGDLLQDILVTQGITKTNLDHLQEDFASFEKRHNEEIDGIHRKLNGFIFRFEGGRDVSVDKR